MKKTLLILSIITLIFAGCKKFDEIEASIVEIVEEKIEKGWDYVKINVEYDYPMELEAVTLYLSEKEDMSDANVYECNVEGKKYSVELDSLKAGVAYYYCYEYDNGYEKEKGKKQNINTISKPVVITKEVSSVNTISATLNGSVTNNAAINKIIEMGFCWDTKQTPTIEGNHYNNGGMIGTGTSDFSYNLTSLQDNVTYYVRAYANTNYGIIYGEEKSFTTVEIVKPTVITNNITNITPTTGTLNGEVTFEGNAIVTAKGFCWDTSPEPTLEDNYSTNGSGIGGFTHALTDLPDNTTYYVRAYATNEKGTAYGEEKSFTTVEVVLPTVVTNDITDITTNSAKCSGTVISDGNSAILAKGVCWSTSPEPTLDDDYTDEGDGSGAFISSLTNLTDGVKYYVRAYATNEKGTSYGEEKSFTTVEVVLPAVVTNDITDITTNSAKCSGAVTSDGNSAILAKGVCWSTSPEPTLNNNYTDEGDGSGAFISSLTNLTDGVKYYVRAYAINEKGTAYGEEKAFTTVEVVLPAVVTNDITDITTNSAKCSGTITSDGNGVILAKGVCWSTSPEPTLDDDYTDEGGGDGTVTSNLTKLVDNTTYYVRAYAINEKGTSYGETMSFTTLIFVETSIVTEITTYSAMSGGDIVLGGGDSDVIECGVCWSTNSNPTISDERTLDGNDYGSYMSNIMDLNDNTTYYVRAYVTNIGGTNYGECKSFTTKSATGKVNGHEWVDLGLPSGLKWATCNIGASTQEAYGNYYSAPSDAANSSWGSTWRQPTSSEQEELINNCTWIWTTENGVNGCKIVGVNGQFIFLPAAGSYYTNGPYSNNNSVGDKGHYLGVSRCVMCFDNDSQWTFYDSPIDNYHYSEYTIRPVIE